MIVLFETSKISQRKKLLLLSGCSTVEIVIGVIFNNLVYQISPNRFRHFAIRSISQAKPLMMKDDNPHAVEVISENETSSSANPGVKSPPSQKARHSAIITAVSKLVMLHKGTVEGMLLYPG